MIRRFQGVDGRERLITSICRQRVVQGIRALATELAETSELCQFEPGEELITQDGVDCDLYLLLTGRVAIHVNTRLVAERTDGQHVGEMALIEPSARRSASIKALKQTVAVRISEPAFSALADKYPSLWRSLALELAERLRERNRFVKVPNPKPVLFVGSSVESLPIAHQIQSGLDYDDMTVRLWTDDIFKPSHSTMEDLEEAIDESDFAVLVLGQDDVVISRDQEDSAPRDNIIFELGLCMGSLKRQRTLIVKPRGVSLRIPSDLLGITPIQYAAGGPKDLASRIAPVCSAIRQTVARLGVK